MSGLTDPSTISRWMSEPGPIELRHHEHGPDPVEGKGIVLAVGVGLVLLAVGFGLVYRHELIRWLTA